MYDLYAPHNLNNFLKDNELESLKSILARYGEEKLICISNYFNIIFEISFSPFTRELYLYLYLPTLISNSNNVFATHHSLLFKEDNEKLKTILSPVLFSILV